MPPEAEKKQGQNTPQSSQQRQAATDAVALQQRNSSKRPDSPMLANEKRREALEALVAYLDMAERDCISGAIGVEVSFQKGQIERVRRKSDFIRG